MDTRYVTAAKIRTRFGVSRSTIRKWATNGDIRSITTPSKQHLYLYGDVVNQFDGGPITRDTILYARVSSSKQKEDLERQSQHLQESYTGTVITDIGSGLNWKRPGLQSLLERVYSGTVSEVVVTYRDRLCRFGHELLEWMFAKHNTRLVVLHKQDDGKSSSDPHSELAEDLLAVTTVFTARCHGLRAAQYRKDRRNKKDQAGSNVLRSSEATSMDRNSEMDVQSECSAGQSCERHPPTANSRSSASQPQL